MKPVWRSAALADLRRLHRFLAPKNPRAARHAIEAIRAGVKIPESFPNIGRPIPELDTEYREWTVNFSAGAYVVRYRIAKAQVTILAVRHGREDDA
jgi:plasmid stabilization system protein ParE